MNLLIFIITLVAVGFIMPLILSLPALVSIPLVLILDKIRQQGVLSRTIIFFNLAIIAIGQILVWLLWAAFCVALTLHYTSKPEVTWAWLYWAIGFVLCEETIQYLFEKESLTITNKTDQRLLSYGTAMYKLITIVGFVTFAYFHSVPEYLFEWALDLQSVSSREKLSKDEANPNLYIVLNFAKEGVPLQMAFKSQESNGSKTIEECQDQMASVEQNLLEQATKYSEFEGAIFTGSECIISEIDPLKNKTAQQQIGM